ncbi:MAG TPA: tetratricopeptide repeat protein [Thermoanaerobaculia bacterium]|jgi:tetratricopeptide (TPR) repeat protein|nr:tetratricopeptide repeat protein [Thermoanaerobaculia bacterium]
MTTKPPPSRKKHSRQPSRSEGPTATPAFTAPPEARERWRRALPALLLLAITLLAYLPVLHAGFIWDDDDYVTQNTLLQEPGGLARIWTEVGATPQYYPLVFTTFWLENQLWGLDPTGYHLTNVLLHALAAILLWRVLLRLRIPGALLAGALFAVHPIHVESVAWITERKNVLSAVCFLAALLLFFRFRPPGEPSPGWRKRPAIDYGLALLAFTAALLAKTVAVSLPVVILVVDTWKSRRVRASVWLPTLPLFALGAMFARITANLERAKVGAEGEAWDLSLLERGLVAARALWHYVGKLLWPHPLIFIYPRWRIDAHDAVQWLFPLAALAAFVALWALRKRIGGGPLAAALCYGAMIFPALGFVNVFPMLFSWVADHFLYLASAPLLTLFAAAATSAAKRTGKILGQTAAAAVVVVLAALSWRQIPMYHDVETLWRSTIESNPQAWIAYNNLGVSLVAAGQTDEAIESYKRALDLHPQFFQATSNLAELYLARGRADLAEPLYEKLVVIAPGNAVGQYQLGLARLRQGRTAEAVDRFERALRLRPGMASAHARLGDVALARGDWSGAITRYAEANRREPKDGRSLFLESFALTALGNGPEAIAALRRMIDVEPDNPQALARLARLLATWPDPAARNGTEAVSLAERAAELSHRENGTVLDALAAAYAETGDFSRAAATAGRAAETARSRGRAEAAQTFAGHARRFANRLPLRIGAEPPPRELLAEVAGGGP